MPVLDSTLKINWRQINRPERGTSECNTTVNQRREWDSFVGNISKIICREKGQAVISMNLKVNCAHNPLEMQNKEKGVKN